MKSITLFTNEIDDLDDAIEELWTQFVESGFNLKANSFGLVQFHPDVDADELRLALAEKFLFPFMGTTARAHLLNEQGYQRDAISMLIMTADDVCFFPAVVSYDMGDSLDADVAKAYQTSLSDAEGKPQLILLYGSKLARGIGSDVYVEALDKASGSVPVYGGMASDAFTYKDFCIFTRELVIKIGMVFVSLVGAIKPRFIMEFSLEKLTNFRHIVTASKSATIQTLDNENAVKVFQNDGLVAPTATSGLVIMQYIGTPLMIFETRENGDQIQYMRNITALNMEKGELLCLGNVKEGTTLRIGMLRKEDITRTVHSAVKTLLRSIEQENNDYSTVLISSCGSRYLLLAQEPDAEAKALEGLPMDNLAVMGFYTYGEFCPQSGRDGRNYNTFSNDTFTMAIF